MNIGSGPMAWSLFLIKEIGFRFYSHFHYQGDLDLGLVIVT